MRQRNDLYHHPVRQGRRGENTDPLSKVSARVFHSIRKLSRGYLPSGAVHHDDGVYRAGLGRLDEPVPPDSLGIGEHCDALVIQGKRIRGQANAVAEPHTKRPVDGENEPRHSALLHGGHYMPSNPNSVRARSMTSGVISSRSRSTAYSA